MENTNLTIREDILEIDPPQRERALAECPAENAEDGLATRAKRKRYPCRHIFIDGRQCGSPALRDQNFCYYHQIHRTPILVNAKIRKTKGGFDLTCMDGLDNPTAIQLAIAQVLTRVASEDIPHRNASLLLYGLQIAARNVSRTRPQDPMADSIVEDDLQGAIAGAEKGRIVPQSLNQRIGAALKDPNWTGLKELLEESEAQWETGLQKSEVQT